MNIRPLYSSLFRFYALVSVGFQLVWTFACPAVLQISCLRFAAKDARLNCHFELW